MAGKIKLDLDPKEPITYEREVSIPTPSGEALKVPFTFRHRTRKEMAALADVHVQRQREQWQELQAEALRERQEREEAEKAGKTYLPPFKPAASLIDQALKDDAQAILDIAIGWGLAYDFNLDNVVKFLSLYAGAANVISADYRKSMTEGRLGN